MKLIVEIDIGGRECWRHSLGFLDARNRFILVNTTDTAKRLEPGMRVSISPEFIKKDPTNEESCVFVLRGVEE